MKKEKNPPFHRCYYGGIAMVIVAPAYKKNKKKFKCRSCGEIVSEQVGTISNLIKSYLTSINKG